MVKGARRNAAALPADSNCRARAGRQGINGFRVPLTTNTEFMRLLALEYR